MKITIDIGQKVKIILKKSNCIYEGTFTGKKIIEKTEYITLSPYRQYRKNRFGIANWNEFNFTCLLKKHKIKDIQIIE